MTMSFSHTQIDVDGAPMHLLDFGGPSTAGRVALVLVHGLDGSAANWIDMGPQMASERRVVALDLPGFGRSPLAGRALHLRAAADSVAGAIRALGLGPVELVGNSWGGPVVLWTAVRHPDLVRRVVMLAPAVPRHGRRPVDPVFAAGLLLPYAIPGLMRFEPARRHRQPPRRRVRSLLDLCYAPGRHESAGAYEEMVDVARARDRDDHITAWYLASRSLFAWMSRPAAFHRIADQVTAPVHVIEGGADPIIPSTSIRRTMDRHPTWSHVSLPGVGHVPALEDPDATCAAWDAG